jgi:hypothetical protein
MADGGKPQAKPVRVTRRAADSFKNDHDPSWAARVVPVGWSILNIFKQYNRYNCSMRRSQ